MKKVRQESRVLNMADKRMFSMRICDSDSFLDMPLSTQALYFHLNMRADDDGFVGNPKRIARLIGSSEDEIKLLLAKRFIIGFDNGIIVIKHWRMHNTLKSDRYHPTVYQEEFAQLMIKPNKSYTESCFAESLPEDEKTLLGTEMEPKRNQSGTSDIDIGLGLGKGLDKDLEKEEEEDIVGNQGLCSDPDVPVSKPQCKETKMDEKAIARQFEIEKIIEQWNSLDAYGINPVMRIGKKSMRYKNLNARLEEYGFDGIINAIRKVEESDFLKGKNDKGWTITFDWFVLPNNFIKVAEGNYRNKRKNVERRTDLDDIM